MLAIPPGELADLGGADFAIAVVDDDIAFCRSDGPGRLAGADLTAEAVDMFRDGDGVGIMWSVW